LFFLQKDALIGKLGSLNLVVRANFNKATRLWENTESGPTVKQVINIKPDLYNCKSFELWRYFDFQLCKFFNQHARNALHIER